MSGIILALRKHRPNREHNAHTSQYPPLSGVCACFVLLVVLFLASLKIMCCKPYQLTQLKAISHYSCALSSMPDFSSQIKMFQLVRNAVQFARFARKKFEKYEVSCLLRHELVHFNQRTIPLLCWQVQAFFSQRLPRGSRCFVRCESSSRRLLAAAIRPTVFTAWLSRRSLSTRTQAACLGHIWRISLLPCKTPPTKLLVGTK